MKAGSASLMLKLRLVRAEAGPVAQENICFRVATEIFSIVVLN